ELESPHSVERPPRQGMQLTRRLGIIEGEKGRGGDDFGVKARFGRLVLVVPVGHAVLEELAHLVMGGQRHLLEYRASHQIGVVGVAGAALLLAGPPQRPRVQEGRSAGEGEFLRQRLVRCVGRWLRDFRRLDLLGKRPAAGDSQGRNRDQADEPVPYTHGGTPRVGKDDPFLADAWEGRKGRPCQLGVIAILVYQLTLGPLSSQWST